MVFKVTITIAFNGMVEGNHWDQWFWGKTTICTIGPTMEWLCTIVEVCVVFGPSSGSDNWITASCFANSRRNSTFGFHKLTSFFIANNEDNKEIRASATVVPN